jgi:hypothetical protein
MHTSPFHTLQQLPEQTGNASISTTARATVVLPALKDTMSNTPLISIVNETCLHGFPWLCRKYATTNATARTELQMPSTVLTVL